MLEMPLILLLMFIPFVGSGVIYLSRHNEKLAVNQYKVAVFTAAINLFLSLIMFYFFDSSSSDFQFMHESIWFGDVSLIFGVDGISMPLILLSTFFVFLVMLLTPPKFHQDSYLYYILFLVMGSIIVGVFTALDLFAFYLFFEFGLIPLFLIIGLWGGERKIYASYKFFLYTLFGSILMLAAIIGIFVESGTSSLIELRSSAVLSEQFQFWCFWAFFISFAIKVPMFPFHTWLPDAHVEAPTAGSVILAAILLKMGAYGFIRFSLPLFPSASTESQTVVFILSAVAIIYASMVAFAQKDIKKLIAYSSVAHMGFVTMGIFCFSAEGISGAMYQMISHGFISGALFILVGMVYNQTHTRAIDDYGGIAAKMPVFAGFFLLFTMANVGLPGTSGFVGEFMTLIATFKLNTYVAFAATFGVVLSAIYGLCLYRSVFNGAISRKQLDNLVDISFKDRLLLAGLAFCVIVLGFYTSALSDIYEQSVSNLILTHFSN